MDKNAIQRTAKPRSNGAGRKKAIAKVQLNVRILTTTLVKLKKLSKSSGRSITWIVESAISKAMESYK